MAKKKTSSKKKLPRMKAKKKKQKLSKKYEHVIKGSSHQGPKEKFVMKGTIIGSRVDGTESTLERR